MKSTTDEERQNRMAALQLLEEHGIEMLDGEDINLVASAVESGQTVVLTGNYCDFISYNDIYTATE